MDHHAFAGVKLEMALRAVDNSDTSYHDVKTTIEPQRLHQCLTCGILSRSSLYCWKISKKKRTESGKENSLKTMVKRIRLKKSGKGLLSTDWKGWEPQNCSSLLLVYPRNTTWQVLWK